MPHSYTQVKSSTLGVMNTIQCEQKPIMSTIPVSSIVQRSRFCRLLPLLQMAMCFAAVMLCSVMDVYLSLVELSFFPNMSLQEVHMVLISAD
jgi:hypothetical protein